MRLSNKIGILGGGQLGKMLCQAASPLHLDMYILEKNESFPAFPSAPNYRLGDFTDYDDVMKFGKEVDILSIEIEKVNLEALVELETEEKTVIPSSDVVRVIRDKGLQKNFYKDNGFPTSAFSLYEDKQAVWRAILHGEIEYPFVQKARRDGYDGRGVAIIRNENDLPELMNTACVVEDLVDIEKELSVIVARNREGDITTFPMVEMKFHEKANLVNSLICPSQVSASVTDEAIELGTSIAKAINLTGLLAIELFLDKKGKLWINEAAPRPHNSGHHTIEACNYSQYDIHLRCLLDLSLPKIESLRPSGMFNLLGSAGFDGPPKIEGLDQLMNMTGVYLHWYGKSETRPNRKMGHITVLGKDIDEVEAKLDTISKLIKVIT